MNAGMKYALLLIKIAISTQNINLSIFMYNRPPYYYVVISSKQS